MRRFAARTCIGLSGAFLAFGILSAMLIVEEGISGARYSWLSDAFLATDTGVLVIVWLVARRAIARHPILSAVLKTTVIVAVLLTVFGIVSVGYASTKSRMYVVTMKGDLRNLIAAEEAFFADSGGTRQIHLG